MRIFGYHRHKYIGREKYLTTKMSQVAKISKTTYLDDSYRNFGNSHKLK